MKNNELQRLLLTIDLKDVHLMKNEENKIKKEKTINVIGGGSAVSALAETVAKNDENFYNNMKNNKVQRLFGIKVVLKDVILMKYKENIIKKEHTNKVIGGGAAVSAFAETVAKNDESFYNNMKSNELQRLFVTIVLKDVNLLKNEENKIKKEKTINVIGGGAAVSALVETGAKNDGNDFSNMKNNKSQRPFGTIVVLKDVILMKNKENKIKKEKTINVIGGAADVSAFVETVAKNDENFSNKMKNNELQSFFGIMVVFKGVKFKKTKQLSYWEVVLLFQFLETVAINVEILF